MTPVKFVVIKYEMIVKVTVGKAWMNELQSLIEDTPFDSMGAVSSRPATEEEADLMEELLDE